MKRMPVVFVGHGSPMNAVEENTFIYFKQKRSESSLKGFGSTII
jgi:aromatic ring-opening dioxygenase catalytic subunit (LigB family)